MYSAKSFKRRRTPTTKIDPFFVGFLVLSVHNYAGSMPETYVFLFNRSFCLPTVYCFTNSAVTAGAVYKSNQIFHYTRCNTPERVTSWRGLLRVIAPGQHSSFRRNVATVASRWQHCVRFDRPEI